MIPKRTRNNDRCGERTGEKNRQQHVLGKLLSEAPRNAITLWYLCKSISHQTPIVFSTNAIIF